MKPNAWDQLPEALRRVADDRLTGSSVNGVKAREAVPHLAEMLRPDDVVVDLAEASHSGSSGTLAVAHRRLLFAGVTVTGRLVASLAWDLSSVTGVRHAQKWLGGTVTIESLGAHAEFTDIAPRGRAAEVAARLREAIGG